MKLQFDANQEYQIDAIKAVTDLFEGLPLQEDEFSVSVAKEHGEGMFATQAEDVLAYGNHTMLPDEELLKNLQQVQTRNQLEEGVTLQKTHIGGEGTSAFPQFSVEMETATGKTYVYLRTIHELHNKYGYSKFVVVVPGKAIREGTLKNLDITKEHFKKLYGNKPFWFGVYDSKNMSTVRDFATSRNLSILVINIEAFRKDFDDEDMDPEKGVLFHRPSEKLSGRSPREFIQAVHPILIIDEPQSVDNTALAKKSLALLNPLFTLRYSATHRNPYNLVYRLDPIKAYELRLVKRVAVAEVMGTDGPGADAYVKLMAVTNDGGIKARIEVDEQTDNGPRRKKITVKNGDDLFQKTKQRDAYREGFVVGEISAAEGREYIQFEPSGIRLNVGEAHGGDDEAIKRLQIRKTIEEHFEKELELQGKGIKVLSLFFLDRVSNYREYLEEGEPLPGLYARWFEEEYESLRQKERYAVLEHKPVKQVHGGYFSQDNAGTLRDTNGDTNADQSTYDKIMKEKEQLLSLSEPLKFIFSHSALREGWDNPNVFQICTLNQTNTSIKKRQEIGRGLRLPVREDGENFVRVFDDSINQLVVIANESYKDFAQKLQNEYQDDCGVTFGKINANAFNQLVIEEGGEVHTLTAEEIRQIFEALTTQGILDTEGKLTELFRPEALDFRLDLPERFKPYEVEIIDLLSRYRLERHVVKHQRREVVRVNSQILLSDDFKELWQRIQSKTTYSVKYDSEELVNDVVTKLRQMPSVQAPKVQYIKAEFTTDNRGVTAREVQNAMVAINDEILDLPDIVTYLQRSTNLKRATIIEILQKSERLHEFKINPQRFMDQVAEIFKQELNRLSIDGIEYHRLEGEMYEMTLFEEEEFKAYVEDLISSNKSVYDRIVIDSEIERHFARDLENKDHIKLYVKLPSWFTISTPVGKYNPDWAIVKEDDQKVYFVRETKGTLEEAKLRESEAQKIKCGKKHFASIGMEDFEVVKDADNI